MKLKVLKDRWIPKENVISSCEKKLNRMRALWMDGISSPKLFKAKKVSGNGSVIGLIFLK